MFYYTKSFNAGHELKKNLWKVRENTDNPIARSLMLAELDDSYTITRLPGTGNPRFNIEFKLIPREFEGLQWPARVFNKQFTIQTDDIRDRRDFRRFSSCGLMILFEVVKKHNSVDIYYRYWYADPVPNAEIAMQDVPQQGPAVGHADPQAAPAV